MRRVLMGGVGVAAEAEGREGQNPVFWCPQPLPLTCSEMAANALAIHAACLTRAPIFHPPKKVDCAMCGS